MKTIFSAPELSKTMSNTSSALYICSEMLQLYTQCYKLQVVIVYVENIEPKKTILDHKLKKTLAKVCVKSQGSFHT